MFSEWGSWLHELYDVLRSGEQRHRLSLLHEETEDESVFQNFASVAAAECVGSRFIYRSAVLDSSVGCGQNSYADCCISLAARARGCVYSMKAIVCSREVGCSFVEATYAPSVQEMRQGESESTVHPQMTGKTRAGPCPETDSNIHVCVRVRCRYCFTPSTMLYL